MGIRETLVASLRSLRSNRLRSLLTTMGIVIGVAAVITLVALGDGMKANFDEQFSKIANQITVTTAKGEVPGGGVARPITDQDVKALQDSTAAPHIASVTPSMTGSVTVTVGQTVERASLLGATQNYLQIVDRSISAGSWLSANSANAKEVVIGRDAVSLLWGPGTRPRQIIGQKVRINRTPFKVVGILTPDGQNDNVVIVPFNTARSYLVGSQNGQVSQVIIKATSAGDVDAAEDEITTILDREHLIKTAAQRDYWVRTFSNLLSSRTQFISFLTIFTAAIAAISLIVGGIGVANIMLVSVTERTREIGIRKAIGAPRRAIMKQFLTEAVMLTGLGGLAGIVLGIGLCLIAQVLVHTGLPFTGHGGGAGHVAASQGGGHGGGRGGGRRGGMGMNTFPAPVLTLWPVLVAFGVSLAIGLLAGGYPASRAARMRPIEALRFE